MQYHSIPVHLSLRTEGGRAGAGPAEQAALLYGAALCADMRGVCTRSSGALATLPSPAAAAGQLVTWEGLYLLQVCMDGCMYGWMNTCMYVGRCM
jgi:hypothetical protein